MLTGCDVVFGLAYVAPLDAAPDAPVFDAPPDGAICLAFVMSADADAELISTGGSVTQGHGNEAILNIGVGIQSQGLWRFVTPQVPPGAQVTSLTLRVPFVASARACGSLNQCGPCAAVDASGHYDVAFARSDWDEATACYDFPAIGRTWETAGATGAMDRGPIAGSAAYTAATDLVVDLDPAMATSWIAAHDLSIIVSPSNGAVAIVPQKQFAATDSACGPTQAVASLTMTVCH